MAKIEKANPHQGHREKVRKRFRNEGLEHFEDHNILEMILFYAIPRRDTNVIAHDLLSRFGSLSRVMDAEIDELCEVEGVGEMAASLIKMFPAVAKRYYRDRFRPGKKLPEYGEMGQDLVLHFAGLDREEVYAIFYNNSLTFCGAEVIHRGDINSVGFSIRRLCDAAVLHKAAYLVLAHNHPHGLPIASSEDLSTTSNLKNFLQQMNVILIDHFIVGESRFSSIQKERYDFFLHEFLNEEESAIGDPEKFR